MCKYTFSGFVKTHTKSEHYKYNNNYKTCCEFMTNRVQIGGHASIAISERSCFHHFPGQNGEFWTFSARKWSSHPIKPRHLALISRPFHFPSIPRHRTPVLHFVNSQISNVHLRVSGDLRASAQLENGFAESEATGPQAM